MRRLVYGLLLVWLVVSGCVAPGKTPASGMPRCGVGVSGASADALRKSLTAFFTLRDYALYDSDRRSLSFDRPASRWVTLRYGSFVNPETFVRMKVFVVNVGALDYWIGFDPLIVTERGSGFEQERPFKGKASAEMQSLLELWKLQRLAPSEQ